MSEVDVELEKLRSHRRKVAREADERKRNPNPKSLSAKYIDVFAIRPSTSPSPSNLAPASSPIQRQTSPIRPKKELLKANNVSLKYLREFQDKSATSAAQFNKSVLEEAVNLRNTLLNSIFEANIFCEILNSPIRYRLYLEDESEEVLWNQLLRHEQLHLTNLPRGMSKHLHKSLVEVFDPETSTQKLLLSPEYFYSEHALLRVMVSKQETLSPFIAGESNLGDRNSILSRAQLFSERRPSTQVSTRSKNPKTLPAVSKSLNSSGGINYQPFLGMENEPQLYHQSEAAVGVGVPTAARAMDSPLTGKTRSGSNSWDKAFVSGEDHEVPNHRSPSIAESEPQEVESLLQDLLYEKVSQGNVYENQMKIIQARGWNLL